MDRFKLIDHTGDIGVLAWGRDLKEVFSNAAYGMFSIMADLDGVEEAISREIEVTGEDRECLLVEWLNELLYLSDVDNLLFKRFDLQELDDKHLVGRAYGEMIDPSRHELRTGVKAATYHMLRVEERDGYEAQVILDL